MKAEPMDRIKMSEEIVNCFRRLYHSGMVNLFEGNISMRFGDHYLITPSQQDKETMTADMILEVDEEGAVISGNGKPSSEFRMHREIYRLRPDVSACVHTHSLFATAHAVAGKEIVSDGFAECNMFLGKVPCVPYGRPGTDEIYAHFAEYTSEYNALLLGNHGVVTFGADLKTAFSLTELVEKTAKIGFITQQMGGESRLPAEELEALRSNGSMLRRQAMKNGEKR